MVAAVGGFDGGVVGRAQLAREEGVGEEAAELVTACADDDAVRAAEEGADVVYHTLVALRAVGVTLDDVRRVLDGRRR